MLNAAKLKINFIKQLIISMTFLLFSTQSYSQEAIPQCTNLKTPHNSFVRLSADPRVIKDILEGA